MSSIKIDSTLTDPTGELENAPCSKPIDIASITPQDGQERSSIADDGIILLNYEEDPQTWSKGKKWLCTVINVLMTATIAFCPSIYTAATDDLTAKFHISRTVATLGVTTFLLGFGIGPLLFAPLSEVWGRRMVFLLTMPLYVVGNIACAVAPNIAVMLVFRFVCGVFGSPTVTNSGGSLTDIWPQHQRSVPLALYTAACFLGPVSAPIIGGFLAEYASWKWNFGLLAILGAVDYILLIFFLPETYKPKLLLMKAIRIYGADNIPHPQPKTQYSVILTRPWVMLMTEPILFLLSLYMAFVFGLLYLDFTAYPIVFGDLRGWTPGLAGLSFLGIAVGMALATACSPLLDQLHAHFAQKLGGPKPEARLPHLIVLSWLVPVGLFWFGWTANPPTHWIVSIVAGVPFGVGALALFLGITAYLTDCYGHEYAASALAANAVLRSLFGAVFPLFSRQMYHRLGTPWATSLLGFVAAALAPLPCMLYIWGPWLRARSNFHISATAEKGTGRDAVDVEECPEGKGRVTDSSRQPAS